MELSQILTQMKGESITNNWDVVCAMSAARLTELFEEKYNSANNGGLVSHLEYTMDVLNGLAFVEIDFKIRPPLISFIKEDDKRISLLMRIKEGSAKILTAAGDIHEEQEFPPQDDIEKEPYIRAIVPLMGLRGDVSDGEEGEDVIINFQDSTGTWQIEIDLDPQFQSYVRDAIMEYYHENVEGSDYSLGTLIYRDNPDLVDLTPTSFRFATAAEDLGDGTYSIGSLLLFINVQGGRDVEGRRLSLNKIVDPVPTGFSTALIISSRVLMCVGLYPSLRKLGPVEEVMPIKDEEEDIFGLWKIRCTGGSKKLGKPGTDFDIGLDLRGFRFPEDVEVSFAGLTLETNQVQGINSIHPKVTQSYSYRKKVFPGGSSGQWKTFELDLHFESNGEYHSSILESGDQPGDQGVVFDDKSIESSVTYDRNTGSKPDADRIGEAVDIQFGKVYEDLILFEMKGISTFAVSNLLFPEARIIEFGKKDDGTEDQGVYIPGDMLIVGRVKPLSE